MTTPSDDLADRIADCLGDWLADCGGGMLTSFAFCMEYVDSDGDRAWGVAHNDGQTPAHTLGLLRWHTLNVEQQSIEAMYPEADDD